MTIHETAEARTESSTGQTFGEILSAARVAKNMEPAEIAQALKLPLEKILSIEKSDIHSLPPAAFTSGYLRAYAKLVNVSENEIMASYNSLSGNSPGSTMLGAVSDLPEQATSDHLGMRIVSYSLISLIVVLFILWIQGNGNDDVADKTDAVTTETPVVTIADNSSQENMPGSESMTENPNTGATADVSASSAEEIIAVNKPQETPEPADTVEETEVISETRVANPVAPSGDDVLHLTANADCWGDIVDANDHLLYRSLLKAGNEIELKGQAPFRVFLGDASVVSMSINQVAYDVTPHIRNNKTARFDITEQKALKQAKSNENRLPAPETVEGGSRPAELSSDGVAE